MDKTDPSIKRPDILEADETILWSARVTLEQIKRERSRAVRATYLLFILVLILSGSVAMNNADGSTEASLQNIAVAIGWLAFASLSLAIARWMTKDRSSENPSIYLITDRRLLSLDDIDRVADEMNYAEMEYFVEMGDDRREFLVTRRDDPDGKRNFHFYLAERLPEAKAIVLELLKRRRMEGEGQ